MVSAVSGEGVDHLLAGIETRIAVGRATFAITLPASDGAGLHWLYEEAEVLARDDREGGDTRILARVAPDKEPRLLSRFPAAERQA